MPAMLTVAYRPFSLDGLLYDGVGDVDVPNGFPSLLRFDFDAVDELNRNTFDKEPCNTNLNVNFRLFYIHFRIIFLRANFRLNDDRLMTLYAYY